MTRVQPVWAKNLGLNKSPDFAQLQLRKIGRNRMAKRAHPFGSGYAGLGSEAAP